MQGLQNQTFNTTLGQNSSLLSLLHKELKQIDKSEIPPLRLTIKKHSQPKQISKYEENQKLFIVHNVDRQLISLDELTLIFNKSVGALKCRYSRTRRTVFTPTPIEGLKNASRLWTEEETKRFKEDIFTKDYKELSSQYERSIVALKKKAARIFGSNRLNEIRCEYTSVWLAGVLGVCPTTMFRWLKECNLPHRVRRPVQTKKNKKDKRLVYLIRMDEIVDWLKNQVETQPKFIFDFSKVDYNRIIKEAPEFEDEWFRKHWEEQTYFGALKFWDEKEIRTLINHLNRGAEFNDIAVKMNRTIFSVKKKVARLEKNGRLIRIAPGVYSSPRSSN